MRNGSTEGEAYKLKFQQLFGMQTPKLASLSEASTSVARHSQPRTEDVAPANLTGPGPEIGVSLSSAPDPPRSPPSIQEYTFRGAAQSIPGGKDFVEWVDEDQFTGLRADNLFYPFASESEWEFSRFLAQSSLTMKEVNEFLKLGLVQQCLAPHLSYQTAKELRRRVELLPTGPKWSSKVISYPGFPTKKPIVLFYRNSLECIQFLLRNPLFKDHLDLVPTLLQQDNERLHREWINSDGAWQMQQAIATGRTVLGVVASSDKTNISVMNGDRVAHPFLLSLANIRMDAALKASSHAFLMTGLLPVPKFLCDKTLRGVMENRLFHHCLDIICHPLKLAARDGALLSKSDGSLICAHTPLVSYIVDTPEAADISCVKGKTSHLTMASHNTFGDSFRHPERTGESTWAAISAVSSVVSPDNVAQYMRVSKAHPHRLSGVHLPFWRNWPLSTNPAKFLTPEVLHHVHKAFYDHDFQWGRRILGDSELDFRLSVLHPRSGVRHFKEGVTRLKQLGGREHRELERSFICLVVDAVEREVALALRGLMDFRFMAQAPQINEATLRRMDESLALFHTHKQRIIDAGGREQPHFAIPKLEFLHSIVSSIRWAGVPMQFTADITEKAHSTQIKVPARTETNHRDYDPQIVRHLDRAEKLRLFSLYTGIHLDRLRLDGDSVDVEGGLEDEMQEGDGDGNERFESHVTGPSLTGESTRTSRNLFQAASLYPLLYETESRFITTASTAFLLNRQPTLPKASVDDVARIYAISDLRAALGDFVGGVQVGQPLIGGRRRSARECALPFTELEVWSSVRIQSRAPHTGHPLPSQLLFAQPPTTDSMWPVGRYDAVILSNDLALPWPGAGFRSGFEGHTIAQLRLIMRPRWTAPRADNPYLLYVQRFDLIHQSTVNGRDPTADQLLLRRGTRSDGTRMGGVVDLRHVRVAVELVPKFGSKADPRLTPQTSLEYSTELRLNKYSSKEIFWVLDSVSL
uniref:DUF6830 domain-containing protein n=1 Tax=Mycena chlorophos TaxID=658473 RepID=A0ABQ0M678_MYCCL|nr:predicted protein [Mycena chlorophos]